MCYLSGGNIIANNMGRFKLRTKQQKIERSREIEREEGEQNDDKNMMKMLPTNTLVIVLDFRFSMKEKYEKHKKPNYLLQMN